MPRDALSEALDALRVLSDPARSWGYPPADGMRTFADAARHRVAALMDAERNPRLRSNDEETAGKLAGMDALDS